MKGLSQRCSAVVVNVAAVVFTLLGEVAVVDAAITALAVAVVAVNITVQSIVDAADAVVFILLGEVAVVAAAITALVVVAIALVV